MSNLTVTNPADSSQTFTFGTKGRKPTWLTDALAAGTLKVPEGYVSAKDKVKEVNDSKPARQDNSAISGVTARIAKLNKKLAHAKNIHGAAMRRVDDAAKDVTAIEAEIASTSKVLEMLTPAVTEVVAPVANEVPAEATAV